MADADTDADGDVSDQHDASQPPGLHVHTTTPAFIQSPHVARRSYLALVLRTITALSRYPNS